MKQISVHFVIGADAGCKPAGQRTGAHSNAYSVSAGQRLLAHALSEPNARDLSAYALVLVTLAVVFVNSDMVGVNPLLYLVGYRAYSVSGVRKLAHGDDIDTIVISRNAIRLGEKMELADLSNGVSMAVRPRRR